MNLAEYIGRIKDKKITVIGAGVSNLPLIRLLLSSGCDVTVCDKKSADKLTVSDLDNISRGAKYKLGENYLSDLQADIIFRTPGLLPFDKHLQEAREKGAIVTSEIEAFFQVCPCKIIAVTGSDGKTTTTTIISEILKNAGYNVHLGGNIGRPLLCDVPMFNADDWAVLELSSFQLHSMYCNPEISVITNISPNHLDKHLDYNDYINAKKQIFINQTNDKRLVLNDTDPLLRSFYSFRGPEICTFSDKNFQNNGAYADGKALYVVTSGKSRKIIDKDKILLQGEHNIQNYLAAFAAVNGLVEDKVCKSVAESFKGVEHRLEFVGEVSGVTFINDSIGTSPTRTIAGIRAMKKKPVIILGGYDKQLDFTNLGDEVCKGCKAAFISGDTSSKIMYSIEHSEFNSNFEYFTFPDFKSSVLAAYDYSEDGDIVLMSPACAAFDQFKNFEERGIFFKKIVARIIDDNK